MDEEWNEGYPPSPYKRGVFDRWLNRKMEKKALCQRHQRWEPVRSWRWKAREGTAPSVDEWFALTVEAVTTTGCLCVYSLDPVNGWVAARL